MPMTYYSETQYYKGVPLKLIVYTERHFARQKAKRFILGDPKFGQNIWIPNGYLMPDGQIKPDADLDWLMKQAIRQNKFAKACLDPTLFVSFHIGDRKP